MKIDEVKLEGSYYDVGVQHGKILKCEINDFLKRDFFQINRLSSKRITEKNVSKYVLPYKDIIRTNLPGIYDEVRGLSVGASISLDLAVLLQIRREIIGTSPFTLTGDCSTVGIYNVDKVINAQTIDLNGDMTNLGNVFRINIKGDKNNSEILQYSFSGLLGYMGMNNKGLSVTINLVVSDDWKIGVPPYLLARKFLEFETIEECIELVKNIPIASSRSFLIQDKNKQVILEVTTDDFRIIQSDFLIHTNHFLHKDFISKDVLNVLSKNSSQKRYQILKENLSKTSNKEDIVNIFKDHSLFPVGICAHSRGNIHINETVASVIMYPPERKFYALKGKPCENNYNLFTI